MTLVLLLLAVMWVGAGIYYFRGRPEGRSADSIGSFRRQLNVLERTGPVVIDPAHRMRDRDAGYAGLPAGLLSPGGTGGGGLARSFAATPTVAALRRRRTQKRRRDVFFGLLLGAFGSLLLGLIPGLQVMWYLAVVLILGLAAYVGLLVQVRNRAAERSMKVRFLDAGPAGRAGHLGRPSEPALLLRRSAN